MISFGAEFAALDLLRISLQKLSNESLNYGLEKDLLSGQEILEISSTGRVKISLFDMALKAVRGISNPKLLLDLNYLRIRMNEIIKHYKNFPKDFDKYYSWKDNCEKIYNKIKNTNFS